MTNVDGGPAFPVKPIPVLDKEGMLIGSDFSMKGMSLRDWFAGQALNGLIGGRQGKFKSKDDEFGGDVARLLAVVSYVQADAMLKERASE